VAAEDGNRSRASGGGRPVRIPPGNRCACRERRYASNDTRAKFDGDDETQLRYPGKEASVGKNRPRREHADEHPSLPSTTHRRRDDGQQQIELRFGPEAPPRPAEGLERANEAIRVEEGVVRDDADHIL